MKTRIAHRSLAALALAILVLASPAAASRGYEALVNADTVSPFRAVAEKVVPAVVSIEVERPLGSVMGKHPFMEQFGIPWFDGQMPEDHDPVPGTGSGFLISAEGLVVTNNHVIRSAEAIRVTLPGEREAYEAEVVGSDSKTDLAVLRLLDTDDRDFPFVEQGDSDEVHVGDWSIAVGNPLGQLEGSLTVGVISAKGRHNLAIQGGAPAYQDFLQTDAAINFGNSGGPLVDIRGRAIGINTAINASGQGIGFAIPMNLASRVVEQLVEYGKVTRAFLGVNPTEMTPGKAEALGLGVDEGILIDGVTEGFPADMAGILPGDVIVEMNGKACKDLEQFRFDIAERPVGQPVDLKVYRDGKFLVRSVNLVEYPEDLQVPTRAGSRDWFGMEVESVDGAELAKQLRLDTNEGVVVTGIRPGSPAERAELRVGDVILKIRDQRISDLDSFNEAAEKLRDSRKRIGLLVERSDYTTFLYLTPDEG